VAAHRGSVAGSSGRAGHAWGEGEGRDAAVQGAQGGDGIVVAATLHRCRGAAGGFGCSWVGALLQGRRQHGRDAREKGCTTKIWVGPTTMRI
jgi:hypothetical protein